MQNMLMDSFGDLIHDRIALRETVVKRGDGWPLHWHDYFEFEIVLSGQGNHIHNDSTYSLEPGSAYLMSYYDFHSLKAHTDMRLLNLRFTEEALPKELSGFLSIGGRQIQCRFSPQETVRMQELTSLLEQEKKRNQPFGEILSANLLANLVIFIIRRSNCITGSIAPAPTLIQQAITQIYREFRTDFPLYALAERLSVSANYLGVLFKETVGVSFHDYLNIVRLKYACKLLSTSGLSVKEVAFASGYNSVEYFLSVFKRRLGITPSGYRQLTNH